MKISIQLTLITSALAVAGCAHHDRQASSQYQSYPPSYYATSGSTSEGATANQGSQYQYQGNQFKNRGGTDQSLVMQVQDNLKKDPAFSSFAPRIEVTAMNGTVTLSGSVPNDQDKQRIESMVKSTAGVVTVNNQLTVSLQPTSSGQSSRLYQESTGPITGQASATETEPARTDSSELSKTAPTPGTTPLSIPDSAISSVSTNSLQGQNTPESTAVSPTSQPGTPSRIYSTNQTSITEGSLQTPSGLNFNVQGATETDRALGNKIMQELRTDATFSGQLSGIKVSVDNGKATLNGTAKSEEQKKSIESAVQRVTGVSSVENNIQVSATPTSTTGDLDQNK